MAEKGYVKKSDYAISGSWWEVAAAGRRIALANATKRIRREAADRMVSALLQRVNEVNSSNYYLFRVAKVIAFGSYVDEESHIGEIDVEIQLEPKEPDKGKHFHAIEQRAGKERSKGRRFGTHAEELDSGELEVLLYLKSRSRYLSFIHISPEWQKKLPFYFHALFRNNVPVASQTANSCHA
jgi:hypothetical protein